jgi:hypothetical protein
MTSFVILEFADGRIGGPDLHDRSTFAVAAKEIEVTGGLAGWNLTARSV